MEINSINIKLDKLKKELTNHNRKRPVNLFEITLISEKEVPHSSFLAWLLNPKENHGLNDLFLKEILKKIKFKGNYDVKEVIVETEITELSRRMDIIIHIKDTIICIENKIWDYPTAKQIEDEQNEFKPHYMILLAPKQIIKQFKEENTIDNLNYIDYNYIHKSINEVMSKISNDDVKFLLKNYNINLEENIMENHQKLFSEKTLLYNQYQEFIKEVTNKYEKDCKGILDSIKNKLKYNIPELNKFGITYEKDLYIMNKKWSLKGAEIYLVLDLDIKDINNGKTSISIAIDPYKTSKTIEIRNKIIKNQGKYLEQNGYNKTTGYIIYEKKFEFNNFIEDIYKEIEILMKKGFNEFILDCINSTKTD